MGTAFLYRVTAAQPMAMSAAEEKHVAAPFSFDSGAPNCVYRPTRTDPRRYGLVATVRGA